MARLVSLEPGLLALKHADVEMRFKVRTVISTSIHQPPRPRFLLYYAELALKLLDLRYIHCRVLQQLWTVRRMPSSQPGEFPASLHCL